MNNKFSLISLTVSAAFVIYLIQTALFSAQLSKPAQASDVCGTEYTYEKTGDFSDSKVNIDFRDSDYKISVSAKSGFEIVTVWLDVSGDGDSGYSQSFNHSLNNYDPFGNQINKVKVKVESLCASPSASPSSSSCQSPSPSVSPSTSPSPSPSENPNSSESPSPSEQPSESPVESPVETNSGVGGGNFNPPPGEPDRNYHPAECNMADPPKSVLLQGFVRTSPTSIELSWWPTDVDHYALVFGYVGEDMNMGWPDISKDVSSFTINDLKPNTAINAQIWSFKNNCAAISNTIDP